MATQSTVALLGEICSCVKRIEAATSKKDGGKAAAGGAAMFGGGAAPTKENVDAFKGVAEGIVLLAKGTKDIDEKKADAVAKLLDTLGEKLEKLGDEKNKNGIEALKAFGIVLDNLHPGTMALAALAMIPLSLAMVPMAGAMALFGIPIVGKGAENIGKIGGAFEGLAKSIAILALTIVVSTVALAAVGATAGWGAAAVGAGGGLAIIGIIGAALIYLSNKEVAKGTDAMEKIGKGVMYLAGGLAIISLVFIVSAIAMANMEWTTIGAGAAGVVGAIVGLGFALALLSNEKVAKGTESMKNIGDGILYLGAGLAIISIIFLVSALAISSMSWDAIAGGVFGTLGVIAVFAGLGWVIGKVFSGNDVVKGMQAMNNFGTSMLMLGAGMAIFALVFVVSSLIIASAVSSGDGISVEGLAIGALLGVAGPIGLLAATGFVVGKIFGKDDVVKGATGMEGVGKGLIWLGLGIAVLMIGFGAGAYIGGSLISGDFGEFTPWAMLVAAIAPIGMMAATGWIAGHIFNGDGVATGAANMIEVAKGVAAFGAAYMVMGLAMKLISTVPNPWEMFGMMAATIGVFGVAIALLGVPAFQTVIGPGVQNLKLMTEGILKYMEGFALMAGAIKILSTIDTGKAWSLFGMMAATIGVFGVAVAGLGAPFVYPFAMLGISVMVPLSLAVLGFCTGIAKLAEGMSKVQDPGKLGDDVGALIKNVADAVKDVDISVDTMKSLTLLGEVLNGLARGIGSWADLTGIPEIEGYDKNGQPIFKKSGKAFAVDLAIENIKNVLGGGKDKENGKFSILKPFADFANAAKDLLKPQGLFGGAASTPLAMGIAAAGKIGLALSGIAGGIASFANLQNIKLIDHYDKNGKPVYSKQTVSISTCLKNIYDVLDPGSATSITTLFINLAPKIDKAFNKKTGKAAQVIEQIGGGLSSIGQSIGYFSNIDRLPKIKGYNKDGKPIYDTKGFISINTCFANIESVINGIGNVFETLKTTSTSDGSWFGNSKVSDMQELTEQMDKLVQTLNKIEFKEADEKATKLKDVIAKIKELFDGIKLVDYSSFYSSGWGGTNKVADIKTIVEGTGKTINVINEIQKSEEAVSITKNLNDVYAGCKTLCDTIRTIITDGVLNTAHDLANIAFSSFRLVVNLNMIKNVKNAANVAEGLIDVLKYMRIASAVIAGANTGTTSSKTTGILFWKKTTVTNSSITKINTMTSMVRGLAPLVDQINRIKIGNSLEISKSLSEVTSNMKKVCFNTDTLFFGKNAANGLNKFIDGSERFAKISSALVVSSGAINSMIDKVLDVPDTTLEILRDLTAALNEFTTKDHGENLIKAVVALQSALSTDVGADSGNAEVESAKVEVQKEGVQIPEAKSAEGAGQSEGAGLEAAIRELGGKMDAILNALGEDLRVTVTNNNSWWD